ncbi:ACT domain-containing protein [Allosalinactinospora lopnorensis]|uniref:ACT domain-containing protein n=1 Tax=Allosalinactinospora lopnorensis TaxID=1352348 RepID=UPI000A636366|nr:ACT domain-containing protein [Allosalinactinospora lopnorensis]
MSTAEHDLSRLLTGMEPELRPGAYVFARCAHRDPLPKGVRPVVTVAEDEALTVVCAKGEADAAGLAYDYVAGWITLRIHSALEAVGLTAAVSSTLAEAGVSCNVVAGYYHDHLFVSYEDGPRAVELLRELDAP